MQVTIVPPDALHNVWHKAAQFLENACHSTEQVRADNLDLFQLCLKQEQHLWLVIDEENENEVIGAYTTQMLVYPKYKAMAVPFLGGIRMMDWLDEAMSVLESWAKENDCKTLEGFGRKAWLRALRKHGWKQAYIVVEKDLTDERVSPPDVE